MLGLIACQVGKEPLAVSLMNRAIMLRPDAADYYNNLGIALSRLRRLDEAIAAYRKALALRPDCAQTHSNLGCALKDYGQFAAAAASCREAIRLAPDYPEAHSNLGNALSEQGDLDASIEAYLTAIRLSPHFASAHYNLANVLQQQGRLDEAIASYRKAMELTANYVEAYNNLSNALKNRGELEEAIELLREAVALRPGEALVHSNLIHSLHFQTGCGASVQRSERARWNRRHAEPLRTFRRAHENPRNPDRRLKIGYVSPDFCGHPVALFLLPLLEAHDAGRFEVFCYSSVRRPDAFTSRLRRSAHVWRDVLACSDSELAEQVRRDGIDILVDLTMHSANSRLLAFALKPAPIQVSWLAYPGSTGMETIDYHLTDAYIEPAGEDEASSYDRPIRLPDSWCCYQPLGKVEVGELPAIQAEHVTFGSLNKLSKVTDSVLRCWARVLCAASGSRLLMSCPEGYSRLRILGIFEKGGVTADRVEFITYLSRPDYLRVFQRIDVLLDPFPCNGMTIACDSLWMGVPVLTLPGDMPVSRAGLSLLSTVGLAEFVAGTEEDYVQRAARCANDPARLSETRRSLRKRMQESPLMDAARFARNMEHAYRQIWQTWCATA